MKESTMAIGKITWIEKIIIIAMVPHHFLPLILSLYLKYCVIKWANWQHMTLQKYFSHIQG